MHKNNLEARVFAVRAVVGPSSVLEGDHKQLVLHQCDAVTKWLEQQGRLGTARAEDFQVQLAALDAKVTPILAQAYSNNSHNNDQVPAIPGMSFVLSMPSKLNKFTATQKPFSWQHYKLIVFFAAGDNPAVQTGSGQKDHVAVNMTEEEDHQVAIVVTSPLPIIVSSSLCTFSSGPPRFCPFFPLLNKVLSHLVNSGVTNRNFCKLKFI